MSNGATGWQQVKRWPGWVALAMAVVALLAIGIARDSGPRSSEERADDIAKRLACPICDGESVFESRNGTSENIRNEIRQDVAGGVLTDAQIVDSLVDRYGPQMRLLPRSTGIEALVWVLPVAALVCATAGLVVVFRRWRRAGDMIPTDDDRLLVEAELLRNAAGDVDEP